MSLFNRQSLITITLDCGRDVTSASVKLIMYIKPSGATGVWVATASANSLLYVVQDGDINESGNWKLQTYVELAGKKAYGEIVTQTFIEPVFELLLP